MRILGDYINDSSKAVDVRVAPSTVLKVGQLLKLDGGKAVKADTVQTGAVVGVCLEYHSGAPDTVNKRSDGEYVRVACSPSAVYACTAPIIKADSTAVNSVSDASIAASFDNDAFVGAKLKRISDGAMFDVTAYTASSKSMTITGSVSQNDRFYVFLPDGFIGGALDTDADRLVLTDHSASIALRVSGYDMGRDEIHLAPLLHEYANKRN